MKRELAKYGKDFAKFQKTAATIKDKYATEATAFAETLIKSKVSLLDKEPASLTFTKGVFEIAHSGLCLDHNGLRFTQQPCQHAKGKGYQPYYGGDLKEQELTTTAVMDGKKDTGYVQITQAGKCLYLGGTWKNTEITFANGMSGFEDVLTPNVVGFAGCRAPNTQQHWKILKHGTFLQIASRAANQCLAFSSWGNYPGQGRVTYDACMGADTQVFRIVKYAPLVYFKVSTAIKHLPSSKCVAISRSGFNDIKYGGTSAVQLKDCDGSKYQIFDYMQDYLGRRKFIHKGTGACMQTNEWGVQFGQCSQAEVMYFTPRAGPGGFTFQDSSGKSMANGGNQLEWGACSAAPNRMWVMPASWNVGPVWKDAGYGAKIHGAYDVAFKPAQQKSSAVVKEAAKDAQVQAALSSQQAEMKKGVPGCLTSPTHACYFYQPTSSNFKGYSFQSVETYQGRKLVYGGSSAASDRNANYDYPWALKDDLYPDRVSAIKNDSSTPSKEPTWFICRTSEGGGNVNWDGSSIHVGYVRNRECIALDFSSVGAQAPYPRNSGGYDVLSDGGGLLWVRGGNGNIPENALIMGEQISQNYGQGQKGGMIYSCRAMVGRKTKIGATRDGHVCWVGDTFERFAAVKNFEILSVNPLVKLPPPPKPPLQAPRRPLGDGEKEAQVCVTDDWGRKQCRDCIFTSYGHVEQCYVKNNWGGGGQWYRSSMWSGHDFTKYQRAYDQKHGFGY